MLRGGFGVFYLPESAYGGSLGYAADTNLAATVGGGANAFIPATTLSNPFPNGIVQPTGVVAGTEYRARQQRDLLQPGPQDSARAANTPSASSTSCRGTWRWTRLTSAAGLTTSTPTTTSPAARATSTCSRVAQLQQAQSNPSFLTQSVTNPFAGLIPNNATLNAPTIARSQLLLPYPQFGQVLMAQESVGKLWYDSLQVNVTKRYSTSLVASLAYTWSKNLDAHRVRQLAGCRAHEDAVGLGPPASPGAERRVRSFRSAAAAISCTAASRPVELLLGGWEYNFIGTIQSGTPMNYPGNVNLIGDPTIAGANFNQYFNTCVQQLNGTAVQPNADAYRIHLVLQSGVGDSRAEYAANDSVPQQRAPQPVAAAMGHVAQQAVQLHRAGQFPVPRRGVQHIQHADSGRTRTRTRPM